jgi:hypothetical protein
MTKLTTLIRTAASYGYVYDDSDEQYFVFEYVGGHHFLLMRGRQRFLTIRDANVYFQQVEADLRLAEKAHRLDYLFCENASDFSLLYAGPIMFLLERGEQVFQTKEEVERYLDSVKREIVERCNR